MCGELDQLGYIRRVAYRFAPSCVAYCLLRVFILCKLMTNTDDVALLELLTSCGFIDFCICVFVENAFVFSWQFLAL